MKMNRRKQAGKPERVTAAVLGFVPCAFLALVLFACVLYFAALAPSAFLRGFGASGYYTGVQMYCMEAMADKLIPTGLPSTVLENTLQEEDIKILANASISGNTSSKATAQQNISDALHTNIYDYIEIEQIPHSREQDAEIESIIVEIIAFYESAATFPAAASVRSLGRSVAAALPYLAIVSVVGMAISVVLLNRLLRWAHIVLRYCAWSAGGAALMLTALPLAILLWGGYRRIHLAPQHLYQFFVTHIQNTLITCMLAGLICFGISILLGLLAEHKRRAVTRPMGKTN